MSMVIFHLSVLREKTSLMKDLEKYIKDLEIRLQKDIKDLENRLTMRILLINGTLLALLTALSKFIK